MSDDEEDRGSGSDGDSSNNSIGCGRKFVAFWGKRGQGQVIDPCWRSHRVVHNSSRLILLHSHAGHLLWGCRWNVQWNA